MSGGAAGCAQYGCKMQQLHGRCGSAVHRTSGPGQAAKSPANQFLIASVAVHAFPVAGMFPLA